VPKATRVCAVCDAQFTGDARKLACSEVCAQRRRWRTRHGLPIRNAEQGPKRFATVYSRVCEHCACEFTTRRSSTRFCSTRCSRGFGKAHRSLDEWLALVDRSDPDGCHLWPADGPYSSHGYPTSKGHEWPGEVYVHRLLHLREHGSIPVGWEPDHTCRVKRCVRDDHRELVPQAENKRRAAPYRRPQKRRVGKCPHADLDVYWDPSGRRVCRICRRARTRLWRAEQPSGLAASS
jgi:hypothetical protein